MSTKPKKLHVIKSEKCARCGKTVEQHERGDRRFPAFCGTCQRDNLWRTRS